MFTFRKPSSLSRDLAVIPDYPLELSPHLYPALNGTQLALREVQNIFATSSTLKAGDSSRVTITTESTINGKTRSSVVSYKFTPQDSFFFIRQTIT